MQIPTMRQTSTKVVLFARILHTEQAVLSQGSHVPSPCPVEARSVDHVIVLTILGCPICPFMF